jgi:hypothetical protein
MPRSENFLSAFGKHVMDILCSKQEGPELPRRLVAGICVSLILEEVLLLDSVHVALGFDWVE